MHQKAHRPIRQYAGKDEERADELANFRQELLMITMLMPDRFRDDFEISSDKAGPSYADAGRLVSEAVARLVNIDNEREAETTAIRASG